MNRRRWRRVPEGVAVPGWGGRGKFPARESGPLASGVGDSGLKQARAGSFGRTGDGGELMRPLRSDRVKRLVVGTLMTNCYLWAGPRGIVVVDPGDEAGRILAAVERMGGRAAAVLLTHGHPDHTAAAGEVAEALGVEIWAHEGDRALLDGGVMVPGLEAPAVEARYFSDEDLPAELGLRVLHLPGHSPGSVAYVFEDGAFVGDVLFAGGIGRTDLPGGDDEAMVRSLRRLAGELGDDATVYPGHGPPTTLAAERAGNPWLRAALGIA